MQKTSCLLLGLEYRYVLMRNGRNVIVIVSLVSFSFSDTGVLKKFRSFETCSVGNLGPAGWSCEFCSSDK